LAVVFAAFMVPRQDPAADLPARPGGPDQAAGDPTGAGVEAGPGTR
jgi:hypothetical protein